MYQLGQGSEPESVCGLVADRTCKLSAKDLVLVPQHEKLRVFRRLATKQHSWDGEQIPGHLVQQGHDHPSMLSNWQPRRPTSDDDFSSGTGKTVHTTIADPDGVRAADLVKRCFVAGAPNRLWVADFTYVATWAGTVYVAFAIDVFSRKIVGWQASTSKETDLVLDAIDMGLRHRDYCVDSENNKLIHHSDAGSQYTSFRFTQHLIDAGIDASIGAVGDAYDNALAESTIGLYKTELIKPRKPWHNKNEVEIATAAWVEWYNNRRLHEACGYRPPTEFETLYELGDLTSLVA
jgi:putative transposase